MKVKRPGVSRYVNKLLFIAVAGNSISAGGAPAFEFLLKDGPDRFLSNGHLMGIPKCGNEIVQRTLERFASYHCSAP